MTSAHPVESPVGAWREHLGGKSIRRTIIEVEKIPVNESTVVFCWAHISHSRFDILCIYIVYIHYFIYISLHVYRVVPGSICKTQNSCIVGHHSILV